MVRWLVAFWLVVTAGWVAAAEVPLPALAARVTDLTGTLTPNQSASLESSLATLETETGAQVAVLLLPTTQPETIEQFGIRLAEAWKIGHKGADNGVILIVAKNDRRVRIEVGYGLEGALNDATCQRIIREVIAPRFKAGDFYGGLQAAVDAMRPLIRGEMGAWSGSPGAPAASRGAPGGVDEAVDFFGQHENVFWVVAGAVLIGVTFLRWILGDVLGSSVTGGVVGIVAYLLTFSFLAALIAAGIGFLVALIGVNFIWSAVLSGGSGRSGGFGSGGGFSGGGGSFGGGGSSGSW